MPSPIIKREAVNFERAVLEEFVVPNKSIIRSNQVQQNENESQKSAPQRRRAFIPESDVRSHPEKVEICTVDFAKQEVSVENEGLDPQSIANTDKELAQEIYDQEYLDSFEERIGAEWQEKLDKAVEVAQKSGFEEGYNQAKEQYEKKVELSKNEFKQGLERFRESWENYLKRSEATLLSIAMEITQFIIDVPLPQKFSDITQRVLNEALDQLASDTPLTLSLNPLDLLRLQESGMLDVMMDKFSALRWDPQPTLKEGNWIIQTPKQAIRRISDELLEHLKDQFGLADHGQVDIEVNAALPGYEIEYIPPVTNVTVSTTPASLKEPSSESNPSATSASLGINDTQLNSVVFTPATSTANSSPNTLTSPKNDADAKSKA